MIFAIRDLSFDLGPLFLEGWLALAARAVCALLLLLAGWIVSALLRTKVFPALEKRTWRLSATPILLRSLKLPLQHMAVWTGLYLALASLPWAIPGVAKFLPIWPTCCSLPAARRSVPTKRCSPCWTPPTRCWSSCWAWPPSPRKWASPSAASSPVPDWSA